MEYLFDKVVLVSLVFSQFEGAGTTSTTNYTRDSRIIDTASGNLMRPGRLARFRCQFYIKNPSKINGYILSPAVLDSYSLPNPLTTMTVFRSYAGIKIDAGVVYAVVKEAGKPEKTYPINFDLEMDGATFTKTYALEIVHNINFTEIIINNKSYGTFTSDVIGSNTSYQTFYPFFSMGKSTDATSVNIVCENIQYLQNKN